MRSSLRLTLAATFLLLGVFLVFDSLLSASRAQYFPGGCPGRIINHSGGLACQCPNGSLANWIGGRIVCGGGQRQHRPACPAGSYVHGRYCIPNGHVACPGTGGQHSCPSNQVCWSSPPGYGVAQGQLRTCTTAEQAAELDRQFREDMKKKRAEAEKRRQEEAKKREERRKAAERKREDERVAKIEAQKDKIKKDHAALSAERSKQIGSLVTGKTRDPAQGDVDEVKRIFDELRSRHVLGRLDGSGRSTPEIVSPRQTPSPGPVTRPSGRPVTLATPTVSPERPLRQMPPIVVSPGIPTTETRIIGSAADDRQTTQTPPQPEPPVATDDKSFVQEWMTGRSTSGQSALEKHLDDARRARSQLQEQLEAIDDSVATQQRDAILQELDYLGKAIKRAKGVISSLKQSKTDRIRSPASGSGNGAQHGQRQSEVDDFCKPTLTKGCVYVLPKNIETEQYFEFENPRLESPRVR